MKRRIHHSVWPIVMVVLTWGWTLSLPVPAGQIKDSPVFEDQLATRWEDWSWGGVIRRFTNQAPVQEGTSSVSVTYTEGWSGFKLANPKGFDVKGYDLFRFYIHGGDTGGQRVTVEIRSHQRELSQIIIPRPGFWTQIDLPLGDLPPSARIMSVWWFNDSAGPQPSFYLDGIRFIAVRPSAPAEKGPALSVNVSAEQYPISPDIYGINLADETLVKELAVPLRRWGGNATTRYSWRHDTSNRGSDYFFENVPHDNANPGGLPDGSTTDRYVEENRRHEAQTVLTIPLIGWTPKGREFACGFSVEKYGPQQQVDPHHLECGNGLQPDGRSPIIGNDPRDTSLPIHPSFVQDWIRHLVGRFGTAAEGGVMFYGLDNEPMLWNQSHRDVHPQPTSYNEVRQRTIEYAAAVKAVDQTAKTLGPVAWGWTAYFHSALDQTAGEDWKENPRDRLAHGDMPFIEWYLQQMKGYEESNSLRILDYLDVHYYPQSSGVALSPAGSPETQAGRLRSTRSLWDSTYVDESWIGEPVYLIPRMRTWIQKNYPGTRLAISEYNWGGLEDINGALAQADVLGILGRERVDLAALWAPPDPMQPGAFSFRLYRNYDGAGSRFGDISVRAESADQDQLAIYAARRTTDGALTLMILNKTNRDLESGVSISGYASARKAMVFRYSPANLTSIVRTASQPVSREGFSSIFPASSMTLIVVSEAR